MEIRERNKVRAGIAGKIRALRVARNWTQADLSKRLGLSQGRFSELERGQGSFTAEQLLEVLKLFNVPVSHFAGSPRGAGSGIQNALARLGAAHLQELPDVLPSERLEEAGDVVREALLGVESPRLIASLAPVLVRNLDRINLNKLRAQFLEYGLERRLGWLLENTLAAVRQELSARPPRPAATLYRRAELILNACLGSAPFNRPLRNPRETLDLMDAGILSEKALEAIQDSSSAISRRWAIATALQPDDFLEALKASWAAGSRTPKPPEPRPRKARADKAPAPAPRPENAQAPGDDGKVNQGHRASKQVEMDWD